MVSLGRPSPPEQPMRVQGPISAPFSYLSLWSAAGVSGLGCGKDASRLGKKSPSCRKRALFAVVLAPG